MGRLELALLGAVVSALVSARGEPGQGPNLQGPGDMALGDLGLDDESTFIRDYNRRREERNRILHLDDDVLESDGQPEDIGYGYQRARTAWVLNNIPAGPVEVLSDAYEEPVRAAEEMQAASAFRERLGRLAGRLAASRQRRQHDERPQPHGQPHGQRRLTPFQEELNEALLEALREAWVNYQLETGEIDVPDRDPGSDHISDEDAMIKLNLMDAQEGEDERVKRPAMEPYVRAARSPGASALAWDAYQLNKRDEFQVPEERVESGVAPGPVTRADMEQLAVLLSPLFDDRYEDPAKRSPRRKKSAEQTGAGPHQDSHSDTQVQQDVAQLFGEQDGPQQDAPRALPLTAENTNHTVTDAHEVRVQNPIGHAHETDELSRQHAHEHAHDHEHDHEHAHAHEHAPPMVAAEGPHSHDQAVSKQETSKSPKPTTPGPVGQRRLTKKSVTWSDYFGIDRRRKKSAPSMANNIPVAPVGRAGGDVNTNRVDDAWLLRSYLRAFINGSGARPTRALGRRRRRAGGPYYRVNTSGYAGPGAG